MIENLKEKLQKQKDFFDFESKNFSKKIISLEKEIFEEINQKKIIENNFLNNKEELLNIKNIYQEKFDLLNENLKNCLENIEKKNKDLIKLNKSFLDLKKICLNNNNDKEIKRKSLKDEILEISNEFFEENNINNISRENLIESLIYIYII